MVVPPAGGHGDDRPDKATSEDDPMAGEHSVCTTDSEKLSALPLHLGYQHKKDYLIGVLQYENVPSIIACAMALAILE